MVSTTPLVESSDPCEACDDVCFHCTMTQGGESCLSHLTLRGQTDRMGTYIKGQQRPRPWRGILTGSRIVFFAASIPISGPRSHTLHHESFKQRYTMQLLQVSGLKVFGQLK